METASSAGGNKFTICIRHYQNKAKNQIIFQTIFYAFVIDIIEHMGFCVVFEVSYSADWFVCTILVYPDQAYVHAYARHSVTADSSSNRTYSLTFYDSSN